MDAWEDNWDEEHGEYRDGESEEPDCPHIDTPKGRLWINYNTVIQYQGTDEELILPEGLSCIGTNGFSRAVSLRKITLPRTLTSIRYGAFYGCTGLKEIIADHPIPQIESGAFTGCTSLADSDGLVIFQGIVQACLCEIAHLRIPDHVTGIQDGVFRNHTVLETVQCPDSLETIGHRAFSGCTNLRSAALGRGIRRMESQAFENCSRLSELSSLDRAEVLGNHAFRGCAMLHDLQLSDVVTLGEGVFRDCAGLFDSEGFLIVNHLLLQYRGEAVRLRIPDGITEIDVFAFSGCSQLETAELCPGLRRIRHHAFENCENLREIILPESLEFIGSEAFLGCPQPEILALCDARVLMHYREPAARGFCRNLLRGLPLEEQKPIWFSYMKRMRKTLNLNHIPTLTVMLENGLIPSREKELFLSRTDLSAESVSLLAGYFAEFSTEETVKKSRKKRAPRPADAPPTVTELRKLWSTHPLEDGTLELRGYKGTEAAVTVPDRIGKYQVASIGKNCFRGNKELLSIVIPEGIQRINPCAFSHCSRLLQVSLPDSLREIGLCAFHGCTALKTLRIPEAVTTLGENVFAVSGYIMPGPHGSLFFCRGGEPLKMADLLLQVCPGSPAQVYAEENHISWQPAD